MGKVEAPVVRSILREFASEILTRSKGSPISTATAFTPRAWISSLSMRACPSIAYRVLLCSRPWLPRASHRRTGCQRLVTRHCGFVQRKAYYEECQRYWDRTAPTLGAGGRSWAQWRTVPAARPTGFHCYVWL